MFKKKLTAAEYEALTDGKTFYKKLDDGSYVADSDEDEDAVAGLKTAMERNAKEREAAEKELEATKAARQVDQGKVRQLEQQLRDLETEKLTQKGDWEALMNRQKAESTREKEELQKVISARDKRITDILLDHATMAAISANKGEPKLLRQIVRERLYIETDKDGNENVRVYGDDNKSMRMHPKNPSDPITPAQFVESLREDEVYARAFDGAGASGGGATNGNVRTATEGSVMTISRADANDHHKYEMAKEKATKAGMQLVISSE